MIPLRDINPTRRVPYVTYLFIALNIAMFIYQYIDLTPTQNQEFTHQHGVIPYFLLSGYGPSLSTPLTSMFMHGGLGHLMSNMWFLHVFGDNVEDQLGRLRYVFFYFFTGVVAVLAHALIQPSSQLPLVGASGAISGVLGAYLLMFPRARVVTFFPIFFFFELPAFFFILIWFAMQVFSGCDSLSSTQTAGVAFFAHVGGFCAGLGFVALGGRPKRAVGYLGPRVESRQLRR
ncbi:MAG: rhomboid family serine protease [Myxococcaceae bacterium]|nr:rhomboid family serine protease [Myxococcaceae bacterium]